jgi:hypothetical protein
MSSIGLATGDQKDGDAVNALIGLIKGGRQAAGDDPDVAWSSDMAAALKGAEDRARVSGASLISALHFSSGTGLSQFVEWVSSRVKSWSSVRKQMPAMADLLDMACEEYNWQWKTSATPMLLLRWVAMDWGEISENDLVALMIALVENGANTTGRRGRLRNGYHQR